MPSVVPNSVTDDAWNAKINAASDTVKVMALTSSYVPSKSHSKRSDLSNEISSAGYTPGGANVTMTSTKDNVNNREDIGLGGTSWTGVTATPRYFAYYKARGGAASADELIYINDAGDVPVTAGTLTLNASTVRYQN